MCQSTKGVVMPKKLINVAESQLGSPCEFFYNTEKTYVLSYSSRSNQMAGRTNFLVLKVDNAEIIESGSFRPGYIRWISNTTLEYLDAPEIIGLDDSLDNYKKTIVLKAP
jgi:hypothetical protein